MKTYTLALSLLSVLLLFSCRKDKKSPPATSSPFPHTDTFSGAGHVTHNYEDFAGTVEFSLDTSYINSVFVTHVDSNTLAFNFMFRDYKLDNSQAGYSAYIYTQSDTFSFAATGIYSDSSRYHKTKYQLFGDSLTISKSDFSPFADEYNARSFYFSGKK